LVFSVILTKKFASLILEIARGVDSPIINLGFGDVANTIAKWQFGSPKKVSRPCAKSIVLLTQGLLILEALGGNRYVE